tara:strand:- start:1384 stop:1965 length:582 start_codon:yes stop_codon:yes gene_type:complete
MMTGKIYKLVGSGLTYYGSTISSLGTRKSGHKQSYKRYLLNNSKYLTSFDIIEKGDFDIELVEDNIEKEQLLIREGFYIKNNECVNKRIAGRTKQEYYKDNEEKMKAYKSQWTKDNRERINENYQENKTEINRKRRIHMSSEIMKLKKKEQDAKYRTENKAKIDARKKVKLPCPTCSKLITSSNLKRHMKQHE